MAYLGQPPFQEFTNPPTKDSFTGDGSTTAFDMSAEVASSAQNALEVYVDNVTDERGEISNNFVFDVPRVTYIRQTTLGLRFKRNF